MSEDLNDYFRKITSIQRAIEPVLKWQKVFATPLSATLSKNYLPSAAAAVLVSHVFKQPSFFDSAAVMQANLQGNKFKAILGNAKLLDAVGAIAKNQQNIFSTLFPKGLAQNTFINRQVPMPSFTAALDANLWGYTSKIATVQSALQGLSSKIAAKGIGGINVEFLNSFQTTTSQAVAISQEIAKTEYATKENIAKLEAFIGSSLEKFKEGVSEQIKATGKSPMAIIALWVGIFGILVTLWSILQTYQSPSAPSSQAATHQDMHDLKQFVGAQFKDALAFATIEATIRINCNLRYQPALNSNGFFRLKAGEPVRILDANHKWVRIAVIDPNDNLPVMGWVLRKYLNRK